MQRNNLRGFLVTLGALALIIFALTFFTAGGVSAALDACRGDPILHLSNGSTLTVTVDIATGAKDVLNVDYVITIPKGVSVVSTEKVNDKFAETVTILTGQASVYKASVTAQTGTSDVAVTATMDLDGATTSASGVSGEALQLRVNGD